MPGAGAFSVSEMLAPKNSRKKVEAEPEKYLLYKSAEDGCMACLQYTLYSLGLLHESKDMRSCNMNLADYAIWTVQKKDYPVEKTADSAIIAAWLLTKWADETKEPIMLL